MRNRATQQRQAAEVWRDVPGYGGLYQASSEGRVRKRLEGGGWRMVKIVDGRGYGGRHQVVNLYMDGHNVQTTVLRVVAMAFYPERMIGDAVAVHRNGLHTDNSLRNLMILSNRENGLRRNISRRRAVCMIDSGGEPREIYPSIRAACRATGLAVKTIYRHCNQLPTRPLPDGVTFEWA